MSGTSLFDWGRKPLDDVFMNCLTWQLCQFCFRQVFPKVYLALSFNDLFLGSKSKSLNKVIRGQLVSLIDLVSSILSGQVYLSFCWERSIL